MKNIIKTVILTGVLLALVVGTGTVQAQTKIATIDLRKVFDNYYKTKQADTLLKEEAIDLEKERKNMIESYKKHDEEYKALIDKANDQAVSSDERAKIKKTAEQKLTELKETEQAVTEFERSARAKLGEKQRIKRDAIVMEIRGIIDTKAKAAGYSLVVDTAGDSINNTPIILYSNGENDITEAVLTQLNSTAPVTPAKSDDKKAEEKSDSKTK
jgi:outer membrane protein